MSPVDRSGRRNTARAAVTARLRSAFWCASAAVSLAALGLAAQDAERGHAPPVIRATTRLVEVNVVVEDKKGEPVSDLAVNDFALWDNGRQQPISVFSVESNRRRASATPSPLPPRTFSNRDERAALPGSLTVILLDGLNTHFDDQAYARAQVVKFLEQIRPEDRVAIYALGSNLRILHDFTSDTQSLLAALARYTTRESGQVAASEPPPRLPSLTVIVPAALGGSNTSSNPAFEAGFDDYLRQTAQQSADFYSVDRSLRTLDALRAIANRLLPVPGRKSLVWLSASFPFTIGAGTANWANVVRGERSLGPEIERTERTLNHANLAIYPVDARGLIGPFGADLHTSAERPTGARSPSEPTIEGVGQVTPAADTMEELARSTGGRAFYGSNDVLGAVRRALADSSLSYTLGYYPQIAWDGSFHEIKVKVRRAGVRVLCRRGYFALDAARSAEETEAALREAALSPLDATGVELTVGARPDPSPGVLDLAVRVDANDLTLEQQGDRWVGSVELLFAQLSAGGQMLAGLRQPVSLRLSRSEWQQMVRQGLSLSGRLRLVPGTDHLRVVARDGSSGNLGSVAFSLDQLKAGKRS